MSRSAHLEWLACEEHRGDLLRGAYARVQSAYAKYARKANGEATAMDESAQPEREIESKRARAHRSDRDDVAFESRLEALHFGAASQEPISRALHVVAMHLERGEAHRR